MFRWGENPIPAKSDDVTTHSFYVDIVCSKFLTTLKCIYIVKMSLLHIYYKELNVSQVNVGITYKMSIDDKNGY